MTEDRRNPYVILGVDYGASRDEARRAAGRVLRRVKHAEDSQYSVEDVTWALHQVEQAIEDPGSIISYFRVPADPTVYERRSLGADSFSAIPLERRTPSPSDADLEGIRTAALDEVLDVFIEATAEKIDLTVMYPTGRSEPA